MSVGPEKAEDAGDCSSTPPSEPTSPLSSIFSDAQIPDTSPRVSIPGYAVVRELGRGGQAVVLLAVYQRTGRKVAVKVMHEGPLADERQRARFDRESQILSALNHPNIVAILDRGRTTDGAEFFTMNYIAGRSLAEHLDDPVTQSKEHCRAELLQLFLRICDAVNAAHLRGIVHRDLKPSNIRVDERGEPHILDFGLARGGLSSFANDAGRMVTVSGQFVGSLPWASPEQAGGSISAIDTRADVYALGVILYQILTGGHFPYDVGGNLRDALNNIMTAAPMPPSAKVSQVGEKSIPRRVRPHVPPSIDEKLDAIVLKALAKRREDRYQTAGELARDVSHYLSGQPISIQPQLEISRRKLVGALCAIAAGSAAAWVIYKRKQPSPTAIANPRNDSGEILPASQPATQQATIGEDEAIERLLALKVKLNRDETKAARPVIWAEVTRRVPDSNLAPLIAALPKLEKLIFARGCADDQTVKWVGQMVKLRILMLVGPAITDAALAQLKNLTSLRELVLEETAITAAGLPVLSGMRRLQVFQLVRTPIGNNGLLNLPHFPELWMLNLEKTEVTDGGLQNLARMSKLTQLGLWLNPISGPGLSALVGRIALRELDMYGCPLGDAGMQYVAAISSLQNLKLAQVGMRGAGLGHLGRLTELFSVDLTRNKITDEGLDQLGGLSRLKTLNLAINPVTERGLQVLASLKLPRLAFLNLNSTPTNDVGLAHVGKITSLDRLAVGQTQVTDTGLAHIAGLTLMNDLDLSGTRIGDPGLEMLSTLTRLELLNLRGTRCSDVAVQKIQQRLPKLRILR